jgi:uncharacterized protein YegP (UPF0339 family)
MADRPYPSFLMYRDARKEWRWRYEASNGRTIFESSESYVAKEDCRRGIALAQSSANVPVWETVSA